jgi:hypothetical protein
MEGTAEEFLIDLRVRQCLSVMIRYMQTAPREEAAAFWDQMVHSLITPDMRDMVLSLAPPHVRAAIEERMKRVQQKGTYRTRVEI